VLTRDAALAFAHEWIDAWNSHDLDRILSHYTDDFEMSSPKIATIFGEPSGTLAGKERVRAYWAKGLQGRPNLRFELLDVFSGANSVVIYYRSEEEPLAAELLLLGEDGRVRVGNAHYNV
jgi:hypothetical protein